MFGQKKIIIVSFRIILILFFINEVNAAAVTTVLKTPLSQNGQALLNIVIGKNAHEVTRHAAYDLARYLQKITTAKFEVKIGDGTKGIVVGLPGDFPATSVSAYWPEVGVSDREKYLIRNHNKGVYLVGATPLAVKHAMWDFLYRIGYRQYFPGKKWEIIPYKPTLSVQINVEESPDYVSRRIWYGFGAWDYAKEPFMKWLERNRVASGFKLQTSHTYGKIIRKEKRQFDNHPEYYALVNGKRQIRPNAKFCISNKQLRNLVVNYALNYFKENPLSESISMEPSDGGGWCECKACKNLGGVSDRALLLANDVAVAINKNSKFSEKYVGMNAYHLHSPPPSTPVHPNVIISVATSFLRGGFTLDEIISGWHSKGATLAIREYYSVNQWDRDMPGRARGSNIDYLSRTIPKFYKDGARFISAESSDNWGPNGLGYYLSARMLWDTKEANKTDELVEDFLIQAFGKAKEPMRRFYQQIDGSKQHLILDDQIGRMFRALAEAKKLTTSLAVQERLNDLVLYVHYVELYNFYSNAKGITRQKKFEELIRYAYRMRRTMMIHTKALYKNLVRLDKAVSIPEGAGWKVAEANNPWKSSKPFSKSESESYLKEGIQTHQLVRVDFEPVQFSHNLIPAKGLSLTGVSLGNSITGRRLQTFYTWVDKAPADIELEITGGLIAHYRDRGNVRVDLWKINNDDMDQYNVPVDKDRSVPPNGTPHKIVLVAKKVGLHKITIADGGDMTRVKWRPGTPMTFESSIDKPVKIKGRYSAYFYVPKNTKVVGIYGGKRGEIINSSGEKIFSLKKRKIGYYSIPVSKGDDQQLWKINNATGKSIRLMTVPPYFSLSPSEILLPEKVVKGHH